MTTRRGFLGGLISAAGAALILPKIQVPVLTPTLVSPTPNTSIWLPPEQGWPTWTGSVEEVANWRLAELNNEVILAPTNASVEINADVWGDVDITKYWTQPVTIGQSTFWIVNQTSEFVTDSALTTNLKLVSTGVVNTKDIDADNFRALAAKAFGVKSRDIIKWQTDIAYNSVDITPFKGHRLILYDEI